MPSLSLPVEARNSVAIPTQAADGAPLPDQIDGLAFASETDALLPKIDLDKPVGRPKHPQRKFVLALMCMLIVVIDIGGYMSIPAQTQIFENDVCRRSYGLQHEPPEAWNLTSLDCSTDAILKEVSTLNGIKDMVETIPSLVLALPYGVVADRVGRKPVVALALAGLLLNEGWARVVTWWWNIFPTRLVWLGPVSFLLGGGGAVATSMVFTIAADVFPQEQCANVFFLLLSCQLVSTIIAAPIGAALAQTAPWVAYLMSFGIMFFGSLGIIFLPETLDRTSDAHKPNISQEAFTTTFEGGVRKIHERIIHAAKAAYASTGFIWQDRSITLLLFIFFVGNLSKQSLVVIVLYAKRRYGWNIGESSQTITTSAVANLVGFLALPVITTVIVRRYRLSTSAKDLVLSEGQNVLLIAGMLMIAFSSTQWLLFAGLVIFGLGCGYVATVRSLMTALVPQDHLATLYTAITTMQSLGSIVAGPMQAASFNKGVDLGGGYWLGMPFMIASALYVVALLGLLLVKLPKAEDTIIESDD